MKKIRSPAVAGFFYASTKSELIKQIEECFTSYLGPGKLPQLNLKGKREIVSLISPHAGYMYSGPVAAHGFLSLAEDGKPDVVVLLGPNHTGRGSGVSLMPSGIWRTPLGEVEIDEELCREIVSKSDIIDLDEEAHLHEHSIEVQLPFLQYVLKEFKIVPICMMMQDLNTSKEVGKAIAEAIKERNAIIVASTDFTHYESQETAFRKDKAVINAIIGLDEEEMMKIIFELNVSMCGPGPVAAALSASKLLGGKKATLLKYSTSGDVTKDYSAVVGYASIKVTR